MCLGIPYEVAEVLDEESCVVRVGSGLRHCFAGLVDEVAVGDWLVVHAGFAVEKITERAARENLALIERYVLGDNTYRGDLAAAEAPPRAAPENAAERAPEPRQES